MSVYSVQAEKGGFHAKLWRGERMALLGFDVLHPEDDFVGFAIEVKSPGSGQYWPLRNRLAFEYNNTGVTGARVYSSLEAPFQKFRWLHFPKDPRAGTYSYRVTKMHMPRLETLVAGTQLTLDLDLDPISLPGFLDVGFTRNFASSQAYAERFGNNPNIIPRRAAEGLEFDKSTQNPDAYEWLGFEALALLKETLATVIADPDLSLDVLAYDLNEPDLVAAFEQLGPRLRIVIDDSGEHAEPHSAESLAAERLRHTAGTDHVTRTHFIKLQHHKVLIVSRRGVPETVVCGSTNFTFRGLYIQANNLLRFQDPGIAGLFSRVFEVAFTAPETFKDHPLAKMWHGFGGPGTAQPRVSLCFSPHRDTALSLNPVAAAIDQAQSSVFYAIAFLGQTKTGPVKAALDRLIDRPLFSYGISNQRSKLAVRKPDGSTGLVDFRYLSSNAPPPFRAEWRAGNGINIHHKFVVTDFHLPTARLFTGSSNLSVSGEEGNSDHLIEINDPRIATAFALESVRMFDHLHFRSMMAEKATETATATAPVRPLTLRTPVALSGAAQPWFARDFVTDSQRERDRLLFSR